MTPFQLANSILETVVRALNNPPATAFAQVGTQVVDCESLIVAVTSLDKSSLPNCDCGRVTVFVTLARDCANESNPDGTNNLEVISSVSQQIDEDGTALHAVGQEYVESEWSVGWTIEGGIAITSLQLTMPMPCTDGAGYGLSNYCG